VPVEQLTICSSLLCEADSFYVCRAGVVDLLPTMRGLGRCSHRRRVPSRPGHPAGGQATSYRLRPWWGSGRQLPVVDENTDYPAHHPTHPAPPTPGLIRGGGGPGLPKAPDLFCPGLFSHSERATACRWRLPLPWGDGAGGQPLPKVERGTTRLLVLRSLSFPPGCESGAECRQVPRFVVAVAFGEVRRQVQRRLCVRVADVLAGRALDDLRRG